MSSEAKSNTNANRVICLACYDGRLASVFDNASELKLFTIDDDKICPAGYLSLPSKDPKDRTSAILTCGANILICGAICGCTWDQLEQSGIQVIPWLRGSVDEIIEGFKSNTLRGFIMPGCKARGGRCRQGRMHQNKKPNLDCKNLNSTRRNI